MARSKESTRPLKKHKAKLRSAAPETEQDFQEAADLEEETGGKWRAGDPAKSGRAFVRALEIYDQALQRHPQSFDLAYNKARLELEITQRPALVAHIGLPLSELLKQTLLSHRYALRLNEENPDVLFNTSQVLIALAEQFLESDGHATDEAVTLLQEALEVLSACLSRQEMLLEQQRADFEEVEEGGGGVAVEADEKPVSTPIAEESGELATIESPVTPADLLDTVQASLSALNTLVSVADASALQTYGDMAQTLTESRAPAFISQLPAEEQGAARFQLAIDRASFIAALADAQYNAFTIEAETYLARLTTFDEIPNKDQHPEALQSEAGARSEFCRSIILRFDESADPSELPTEICWKQLSLAQTCYGKAAKLGPSTETYLSRGDAEMLRHRIATWPSGKVSDAIRKSAPTLVQNAETYYRGAAKLAGGDEGLREKALERLLVAALVRGVFYGVQLDKEVEERVRAGGEVVLTGLEGCVEEGLVDQQSAKKLAQALSN
ncbi:hypothetical protein Tdes44962_MAKER04070 [Teratosphaeria destructans]|uniref:Uncharacterized protein n=1 Tax=Teratosphaeria destructans TaxID=418781 RepID=A0A9W7SNV5_9PEZI|nr:hypothetical protein Tdes44962_MAKER04070 [Teratosphaeria destructans]